MVLLTALTGAALGSWFLWNNYSDRLFGGKGQARSTLDHTAPDLHCGHAVDRSQGLHAKATAAFAAAAHHRAGRRHDSRRQPEWGDGCLYQTDRESGYVGDGESRRPHRRGPPAIGPEHYDAVIADLQQATYLGQQGARAATYLGQAWLGKKDYEKAAVEFERVMSLDPGGKWAEASRKPYAEVCLELGTAALKKGDYDTAIKHLNRASHYDPSNPRIFDRRAGAWFGKSEFAKAIIDYSKLIPLETVNKDMAYVHRGVAYQENDDLDNAMKDFTEAIHINAQNSDAFENRGFAYLVKSQANGSAADLQSAIDDLSSAVKILHKNPDANDLEANSKLERALRFRASCYMLANEWQPAAADFTEILRLDPHGGKGLHDLLDGLARGFADEKKFSEAAQWEQKAIDLAPDDAAEAKAGYRARLKQYQRAKH